MGGSSGPWGRPLDIAGEDLRNSNDTRKLQVYNPDYSTNFKADPVLKLRKRLTRSAVVFVSSTDPSISYGDILRTAREKISIRDIGIEHILKSGVPHPEVL